MPLGVLQTYDRDESALLYEVLGRSRANYALNSSEFVLLSKAMDDALQDDPIQGAEEYGESELRELYVLLARANCAYEIDSEEFHVITKAMTDYREQM
jgi:hypothetical protein